MYINIYCDLLGNFWVKNTIFKNDMCSVDIFRDNDTVKLDIVFKDSDHDEETLRRLISIYSLCLLVIRVAMVLMDSRISEKYEIWVRQTSRSWWNVRIQSSWYTRRRRARRCHRDDQYWWCILRLLTDERSEIQRNKNVLETSIYSQDLFCDRFNHYSIVIMEIDTSPVYWRRSHAIERPVRYFVLRM